MVSKTQQLKVVNTGQRPVQVSFLTTPNKKSICKPWLNIKPESAVILNGEELSL